MADGENVAGKIGLDTTDWKTGISEINRDVRVIESGFKAVAAGMDDWKNSADGLTQRNNALSEIIGKQKEKVALLEGEYERLKKAAEENGDTTSKTANALSEFEIKVNKAREQLAKSETEYRKNSASLQEMEKMQSEADKSTKGFVESLKSAASGLTEFSGKLQPVVDALGKTIVAAAKAAAAAVAAIGASIAAATKQAFDFAQGAGAMADNFLTLSAVTGVSATDLQKWQYTSNFIDVSVDTLTGSMTKLVTKMSSSSTAFETLGVKTKDSSGHLRDTEAVFADCIDALGKISNETERDAIAMELFGKKAQDLNPLILAGGDAFRQVGEEAERMGVVFNDQAMSAMGAFDDSMQRFKATGEGLKNTIGLVVIPAFQPLVDAATSSMAEVSTALKDGLQPGEFEVIVKKVLEAIENAFKGVGTVINNALPVVMAGLNSLASAVVKYLPGLINQLLPAVTSIIDTLVDAIAKNVGPITECAINLVITLAGAIVNALPKLVPALIEMVSTIASTIWDAVKKTDWGEVGKSILEGVIAGMKGIFSSAKKSITGFFTNIWEGVEDALGINSPSKVAAEDGKNLMYGFQIGANSAKASVGSDFKTIFSNIWNGVKTDLNDTITNNYGQNLIQGVSNGLNAMKNSVISMAKTVGSAISNGINRGMNDGENSIVSAAKNVAMSALNAAKKALGIRSPSRVMEEQVGLPTVQGIAQGVTKNSRILRDSITEATSGMKGAKINPVSMPVAATNQVSQPVVVRAVLKLRETEFGELVTTLADSGQGFKSSNIVRREMGVQFA